MFYNLIPFQETIFRLFKPIYLQKYGFEVNRWLRVGWAINLGRVQLANAMDTGRLI